VKTADFVGLALGNMTKRKLRTGLTVLGVTVGIGALVSMISFGRGMQRNVTTTFESLELFNVLTVSPGGSSRHGGDPDDPAPRPAAGEDPSRPLDDEAAGEIARFPGVETVYPDVNFPALVSLDGKDQLRLVQVLPARVAAGPPFKTAWGRSFASDDERAVVVGRDLLRRLGVADPAKAVGRTVEISSVTLDLSRFNPADMGSLLEGRNVPVSRERYAFVIAGVTANEAAFGPVPMQGDVLMPPGPAREVKRLPFSSVWDLFRIKDGLLGYSALTVRLSSPRSLEAVKKRVREMGFRTFALADQFEEVKRGFLYLDMVLAAVGMIALFVASLGIVNTMAMSILERTREIGVMKAVGARDTDVRQVFFVESAVIGFLGGVAGCGLGWAVSRIINGVVNTFLARQGVPRVDYFAFPLLLFAGAVVFAMLVSLVSGLYPAHRAARVDPVSALRHD
jgi:putative ABC transport system permease protein